VSCPVVVTPLLVSCDSLRIVLLVGGWTASTEERLVMSNPISMMQERGITLDTMGYDTLVALRAEYEATNTTLAGDKDKLESTDSELKKYLLAVASSDESVAETVKNFVSEIRTLFYAAVDSNPDVIFPLVEAISEFKTDSLNERDYWLSKVKRNAAPSERVIDEDYEFKRAENGVLADLIRQLYSWIVQLDPTAVPNGKRGDEFGSLEFPLNAKKVDGEPTGEFMPKLSKLVRSQVDDNPTGKAASNSSLRFRWNGEDIPTDRLPTDVAHDYVSNFAAGFVIDWSGIREEAKKAGSEISSKPGFSWTHEFETGTLEVYVPDNSKPTRKES